MPAPVNVLRVLLVEDEENLREVIKLNLEIEGYEVEIAETGLKAIKKAEQQRFNLIILDVMLPEVDGFAICRKIRTNDTETPVLFLTAKDTSEDKIDGLKAGADDYLTKPFNLEELLLRTKVLIKHSVRGRRQDSEKKTYRFGGNEVNFVTYKAINKAGEEFFLTKKEAALLKLLIERKGTVVPRTQILQLVWGYDVFPSTRTIDNFITTFRRYFEKDPSEPRYFHSIRSVGYKFTE